jgi:hypothetical protein
MTGLLKRPYVMVAAVALLLAAANAARADFLVYSNFGAGNGGNAFNQGTGWTIGNDFSGDNFAVGDTFTANQTGTLAQITVALEYISGPNSATISLMTDAGGVPGAVLESWAVSSLPNFDGNFHTPTSVNDVTNQQLTNGTTYWVVISTASASSQLAWNWNSTGAHANHGESPDGGATWSSGDDTQGAFRVTEQDQTSSTPAPGAFALVITGLGTLAGYRLRRRRK